jgi:hypothetical protein
VVGTCNPQNLCLKRTYLSSLKDVRIYCCIQMTKRTPRVVSHKIRRNITKLTNAHLERSMAACWDRDSDICPTFPEIVRILANDGIAFPETDLAAIAQCYEHRNAFAPHWTTKCSCCSCSSTRRRIGYRVSNPCAIPQSHLLHCARVSLSLQRHGFFPVSTPQSHLRRRSRACRIAQN